MDLNLKGKFDKVKQFFAKIGRRNLIIACSLMLICAAVYLNWKFFSDADKDDGSGIYTPGVGLSRGDEEGVGGDGADPGTISSDAYFAASQISRRRARDEAIEVLQAVVDNTASTEAVINQALTDISRIARDIEIESNIETLIVSKGFEQCVAIVSGSTANIIIESDSLLPNQYAQIYEIVYEQSGIEPVNVKIIPRTPV